MFISVENLVWAFDGLHQFVDPELLVSYVHPVSYCKVGVEYPKPGVEVLLVPKLCSVKGTLEFEYHP